ncbi:glutamine--tRNA ligase/YqeY domain fusion protein [Candidatus Acetothermia bacterium]|nr:glutamine--tRNA ligase/YqeY domain fusion protein [Candidatus Acetothermia bacterium]MCI2427142.1 glutamine--tRNA ligase/YqeY domain fusion protein [Candidatus Acetothermia bacterium]MCI2428664.1 glutamine--tRNA ligase/YqeY domain fusion protein [Candidatus Acetothermia bacterium]
MAKDKLHHKNIVSDQEPIDFVRQIIISDLAAGKNSGRLHTRWPPEPNGYIHIGHAKTALLNYWIAKEFGGKFNLRFDDTNPEKESSEYIESIIEDLRWLGIDWEDRLYYASDYFEQLYEWAENLIKAGKAYVCDLSSEEISRYRGKAIRDGDKIITPPGKDSPYRNRFVEENLDLFRRMRAGEFPDGSKTLRAKIDMAHPNLNMRDPVMYRILRTTHHRTGDQWCIYPTYDWTHGQSDSIEGITHSICTLEFENHRPLYDWFLNQLAVFHPQQIEVARMNLSYTVLSKRKLLQLVEQGYVESWNDPRMPTLSALRRRGYTPAAIHDFVNRIGITKSESIIDVALLEHCLRQDLNKHAPRVMGVLAPLKVIITNYPDDQIEYLTAINNPEDATAGTRNVPFSKVLYIEEEDFMEAPPKRFYRLAPGREVRLRYAYLITCTNVVKDEQNNIKEIHCTYDPATRGGNTPDGREVRGTLHWVSAHHAIDGEVRLYEHLFSKENPLLVDEGENWLENLNPNSRIVLTDCKLEPSLAAAKSGDLFQFERQGYFCVDRVDSKSATPIFNRTVTLRDSWAKLQRREEGKSNEK